MASNSLLRHIAVMTFLVFADSAVEMGFVSSMVAYLHRGADGPFTVTNPNGGSFLLSGVPANLIVNQGHTTNGAAGTGVVLIGLVGALALALEHRSRKKYGKSSPVFYFWTLFTVLSWLLTLGALVYTFVVTVQTDAQGIDFAVAENNAFPKVYPDDQWTPENWLSNVLQLPLANEADADQIRFHLQIMRGWRWNLVVMLGLGFVLMDLALTEVLRSMRSSVRYGAEPPFASEGNNQGPSFRSRK